MSVMSQKLNTKTENKTSIISIIPIVHSEAPAKEPKNTEEAAPEEPEEPEEPEDPKPKIEEECSETISCKPLKNHLEECTRRVESGNTDETCAEELLHFMHCLDHCAAPKLFAQLK